MKVHSNHLEARNGWTGQNSVSVGLPPDFCWISDGQMQKQVIFVKSSVHWTSTGLLSKKVLEDAKWQLFPQPPPALEFSTNLVIANGFRYLSHDFTMQISIKRCSK